MSNRTIDDTLGDSVTGLLPIYLPAKDIWENKTCTGCKIQPALNQLFDETWVATTYKAHQKNVSISLPFEGTAISVFFFLANSQNSTQITCLTECNFRLDGFIVGNYSHASDQSGNISYNVPVFDSAVLPATNHTLTIEVTGDHSIFIGFDYAVYTSLAPPASLPISSPPASTTTIFTTPSGNFSNSTLPARSNTNYIPPTITGTSAANGSRIRTKIHLMDVILACVLGGFLLILTSLTFLYLRLRRHFQDYLHRKVPEPTTHTTGPSKQANYERTYNLDAQQPGDTVVASGNGEGHLEARNSRTTIDLTDFGSLYATITPP